MCQAKPRGRQQNGKVCRTLLASRIIMVSDQVSTTEDTTFRGSQKGGKDDHEIHPKYLTLKIKLPLYQNTSKRHL